MNPEGTTPTPPAGGDETSSPRARPGQGQSFHAAWDGVGEWRSGPAAGTALVDGVTFRNRGLVYAVVDGDAVVEGDIVLGPLDEVVADTQARSGGVQAKSLGITGSRFRWPAATVAYTVDATLTDQNRVTDAIAHWESRTRIRFVARTAGNQAQFPSYVTFRPAGGCSANIGCRGGQQFVNLGPACTTGNTIHEIGHTLGLWHEQSREDRNSFVQVVFANIAADKQHNFVQQIADGDDLGAYDYGSIMHYPPAAFSLNGQPTLIALQPAPPGVIMGQRDALSPGDVEGIHAMYPAPQVTLAEQAKSFSDPVAQATFKEAAKDPVIDLVTRKEVIHDGITPPGLAVLGQALGLGGWWGGQRAGDTPFVLASPSGFAAPSHQPPSHQPPSHQPPSHQQQGDPAAAAVAGELSAIAIAVAGLAAQQALLAQHLAVIGEQQQALAAAYDAAVAALSALGGEATDG